MQNTNIEWTDHTLNFWWGCTKVSPACTHCYAETVAKVFGKRLFGTVPTWGAGQPRFQRLEAARKEALALNKKAIKTGTRPRVFVNSMSDWLDAEVPIEWLAYLLETIHLCPNLDFQLLTKRPENWFSRVNKVSGCYNLETAEGKLAWGKTAEWYIGGTPPPNVWIGTTVEDQTRADQRIPHLLLIPARIRFLSCEPLLNSINLLDLYKPLGGHSIGQTAERAKKLYALGCERDHDGDGNCDRHPSGCPKAGIHWVIAGGESGGPARPTHPGWFRSLRNQCAAANVPFHFKQWGEWYPQNEWGFLPAETIDRARTKYPGQKLSDGTLMLRVGSDSTGRQLDGHLHDQFPTV